MLGIDLEDGRVKSPMFVYLRRKFHEVRLNIIYGIIVNIVKHEMQGMPKLMEHGLHVVDALQSRLPAGRGFGHIADIDNDGNLALTFCIVCLASEFRHPCACSLTIAREIVRVEYGQRFAILIGHLPCFCRGFIGRHFIRNLLER